LLLGIPLFNYLINRKENFVGAIPFFLMAVYFGLALLSAIFTDVSRHSIEWLITFALEGMILYFLIINTIRTSDVLRKAIWTILIAGSLMGGVSMYQEFTRSYDNDFGGWAIVKESEIEVGEENILGNQASTRRVAGPIGSKNFYAQFMVVLLPLAISRFSAERSTALRILALVMCIPILGGTLLTYSRGAGIAAVLMIFVMFALGGLRLKHLLIIGGVAFVTVMVFVPNYVYRISTVFDTFNLPNGNLADAGGSVRGRATENLATFNVFLDHPVLGVGPGQTRYYIQEASAEIGYKNLTTDRRGHNLYLEQLSDGGILGFLSYLSIVLITIIQLWRTARRFKASQPDIFYTLIGLLASILTFQITGLFLHLSYIRYYWFLMALAASGVLIFNTPLGRPINHLVADVGQPRRLDRQRLNPAFADADPSQ